MQAKLLSPEHFWANTNAKKVIWSKFGRINIERGQVDGKMIDHVLTEIKTISIKKKSPQHLNLNERLLDPHDACRKLSKYIAKKKPSRKMKTIRQYIRPRNKAPETPGAARYSPDYSVYQTSAPSYTFPKEDNLKNVDPRTFTQSEMMDMWQKGIRGVTFEPSKLVPTEESPPIIQRAPENHVPGIIDWPCSRDSFITKENFPAPAQYYIPRDIEKPKVISFDSQETRKELETLIDRTHVHLAQAIDCIKPKPPHIIPFEKQVPRELSIIKKEDVFTEIEEEQKKYTESAKTIVQPKVITKQKKEPFANQTSNFDKSPFEHLMKTEAPSVDYSPKLIEKKILPIPNFGRRIDDNARTIFNKTEAPDIIYPNVMEEWSKSHRSAGGMPILANMQERKSAYDYMPKACGGNYTFVVQNSWSNRTPVVMDKMGHRKIILSAPPQYAHSRVSTSVLSHFKS